MRKPIIRSLSFVLAVALGALVLSWSRQGVQGRTAPLAAATVSNIGTWHLYDLPNASEPQDNFVPTDSDLHERLTIMSFATQAPGLVTINLQGPPVRAKSPTCIFQLRVDGQADTGYSGGSRSGDQGGYAAVSTRRHVEVPLNITAYFEDLGAGTHELTLWVAGFPGRSCWFNPGNFGIVVHIEELA